jgi:uncharacterized protein (TIGR03435 family)
MERFAATLGQQVDRPVVDRTGLSGIFDVDLEFTSQRAAVDAQAAGPPLIFTAIQEQLGLKLEPTTGPIDVIVIDHIEKPLPN